MADLRGMDPARIERLRSPERLRDFDPDRLWEVVAPPRSGAVIDVGCGVGYVAIPFARRLSALTVYACDILPGMLALLGEAAAAEDLANLVCVEMTPASIPLPDGVASLLVMAQVHHELDAPGPLLVECRRLLASGGTVAIIDWKDEDNGKSPPAGRRVPASTIGTQLESAGFVDVAEHDLYHFHACLTATT